MTNFGEFLNTRIESGGFTTEDCLASFLPLAREVLDAHHADLVAPLNGIDDLHVDGVRIWFEEAKRLQPAAADATVCRLQQEREAAVDILSEMRVTTQFDDGRTQFGEGRQQVINLALGDGDLPVIRPVYLAGYRCWEHSLGCHDPLTDVFSLGMILASMACGHNYQHGDDLQEFAANRNNLFRLVPKMHPVVARAIVRMTQLDRRRRVQDLASLIATLENYRDHEISFDLDLAQSNEFASGSKRDKQTVVLTKLRERLFELSRRNRLLHFRQTMQSVNLTHASVPLSFDIKNIRPDQILTFTNSLQQSLATGKRLSLNKYLNFNEVLYVPSQLERLISESRRDKAEFGFAQLRLVACFLHWANLKEKPIEQFESPLLLLPVELKKKKGIRDTYYLEATTSEAEINPVVRHQFDQLYDIQLPESIDLTAQSLDDLYTLLTRQIESSEAAVTLAKIDRPQIHLIHEKAKRRLDQYRRRARLAGRGVRKFMDLDYSYDPANYHPLGIKLFSVKVRPQSTRLREIIEEKPRPRSFVAPPTEAVEVEKERQFYHMKSGGESSPYDWTLDLCSVTLANFKYRRMSLVRDYDVLLSSPSSNDAFDAVFSLTPRELNRELHEPHALADRFDVVPADPTQAQAIAEASAGNSYIIQGPPGTGKSQTITNLIADFVARGKRVLFVCEKRAAIDVVYARLRQCGLSDLCCLIHDSQSDKKAFVMDLKQTYEALAAQSDRSDGRAKRDNVVEKMTEQLRPLEQFDRCMQSQPDALGLPVRELLDECIPLKASIPHLDMIAKERLPSHADWHRSRAAVEQFEQALRDSGDVLVLAKHPMRILSTRLTDHPRPLEQVIGCANEASGHLDRVEMALSKCGVPRDQWESWENALLLVEYARRLALLAETSCIDLLDKKSAGAKWLTRQQKKQSALQRELVDASDANAHWQHKLSATDTAEALAQAETLARSSFAWLKPVWWRLRRVLKRGYDFQSHVFRPTWTDVLRRLQKEHDLVERQTRLWQEIAQQLQVDEQRVDELIQVVSDIKKWLPAQPKWLQSVHATILKSPKAEQIVINVLQADESIATLRQNLNMICDELTAMSIAELRNCLSKTIDRVDAIDDFMACLRELASVAPTVATALRTMPHSVTEIEAAVCDHSLTQALRRDKAIERFTAKTRQRSADRLARSYDDWLATNSAEIHNRIGARFRENLKIAGLPAAKLTAPQKEFKSRYNKGRRELEHEFGKQMRYKAIRDLVTDESGDVVKDLKPVWLMSPLSVSDTLPLDADHFDVVIFDEASQIRLEEAVPALFRAPQSIIVGDEMQLPPTDFFSAKHRDIEEEEILVEHDGELVEYDLDSGSFLSHAANNLAATMLGWHYRSRSESLISFSNWAFYDGRLLTVPEESLSGGGRTPIVATTAEDGCNAADAVISRPISFHSLPFGVYDKRRNRAEADYIAHMVRAILARDAGHTIGIVAFSEAQQDEIEQALGQLAQQDKEFRNRLEAEFEREDDDQFVGLLVKNLENIQGDERDIIILSICYGHPPSGKMRMNFGPINKAGGEKRLNVAFSRAKKHMAVVSSIRPDDITNDYNDGAKCLKDYLRYAQTVSEGDAAAASRILFGLSRWHPADAQADDAEANVVAAQLAQELRKHDYVVDLSVGQSHFQCDLAVCRAGDAAYRLGVLIDGEAYYEQDDLLERDLMRPRLLQAFGWNITHVLAKDWYADSDKVLQHVLAQIKRA